MSCGPGKFAGSIGSTSCELCAAGRFSSAVGAPNCEVRSAGKRKGKKRTEENRGEEGRGKCRWMDTWGNNMHRSAINTYTNIHKYICITRSHSFAPKARILGAWARPSASCASRAVFRKVSVCPPAPRVRRVNSRVVRAQTSVKTVHLGPTSRTRGARIVTIVRGASFRRTWVSRTALSARKVR